MNTIKRLVYVLLLVMSIAGLFSLPRTSWWGIIPYSGLALWASITWDVLHKGVRSA